MDDPHLKDVKTDGVSDAVRCLICLNTFSGQPVASPQRCDHFYCLTCITEWAKITVELHDRQGLEEEERSAELTVCEECGRSDRRHLMLLCSACDSRFHIACLNPPLAAVPFKDWFCKECATEDSHTNDSFSREESEIAEAEMMDLLSEVVPTSSRLRPSTTAQRAVSVHTCRSERVLQQSSRTHTTVSHTVQHVPRYLLKSSCSNSEDATTSNLILNTQIADKMVTYKKRRRQKTDIPDTV